MWKKYLKNSKDVNWVLDEEAFKKNEMFDGHYAIRTSEKNRKPRDILEAYHNLWKIEKSFCLMKTTLSVRPVFHWNELRVKGHFVICFLYFLLKMDLESNIIRAHLPALPHQIREALNSMNFAEIKIKKRSFLLKSRLRVWAKRF